VYGILKKLPSSFASPSGTSASVADQYEPEGGSVAFGAFGCYGVFFGIALWFGGDLDWVVVLDAHVMVGLYVFAFRFLLDAPDAPYGMGAVVLASRFVFGASVCDRAFGVGGVFDGGFGLLEFGAS